MKLFRFALDTLLKFGTPRFIEIVFVIMAQSKILFTPTRNASCTESLFGGIIWRSHFIQNPSSNFYRPCTKFTTIISRVVFYYHYAVFRRGLNFPFRWITLEFILGAPLPPVGQRAMPCHSEWLFLIRFLDEYSASEQKTSSQLLMLSTSLVRIVHFIFTNNTLFLIRRGPHSNRQTAMDLLIQVFSHILANFEYLDATDVLSVEERMRSIRPKEVGFKHEKISERNFSFVLTGDVTFYYHTYQFCSHQGDKICENCHESHTDHMVHARTFLHSTHTPNPPVRNL